VITGFASLHNLKDDISFRECTKIDGSCKNVQILQSVWINTCYMTRKMFLYIYLCTRHCVFLYMTYLCGEEENNCIDEMK
jgi:hypothetical protein